MIRILIKDRNAKICVKCRDGNGFLTGSIDEIVLVLNILYKVSNLMATFAIFPATIMHTD
jgi:hypothetical protein